MGITDDELIEMAGPGAYERGHDYYRQGFVGDIEIRGNRIVAMVSGTDLYRVELLHDGAGLDGSCDCPASDGIVFCKHCVATALELRDYLTESALAAVDSGDEKVLQAYLAEQDREALVSYVLQLLPKDPLLYERLQRQAMLSADSVNAKGLKRSITRVTPLQDIFEWGKVSSYFRRLEATLKGILETADQLPADILLKTALHGIVRLNKALERIDDSGGYREHAQAILRELHGRALKRIEWTPGQRAEHILEMALADPWDQFEATPLDYAEALGEAGLGAFYTAVETRLAALAAFPKNASFDDRFPYLRLTNFLMIRATEKGDLDEMIRLEKLTATTEIDFEGIARLYVKKGDPETAARWLAKADASATHDRGSRQALWASVHAAIGDWDAAILAQEAVFQRDASYDDYVDLMELAGRANRSEAVRASVINFLSSEDKAYSWSDERRAFTLARILKDDKEWAAVEDTALARISDPDRLLKAARWMAGPAPEKARPVYEKCIDTFIGKKTNRSYRAAIDALLEATPVFDAAGETAFDDCLARLRDTHYRKRNLMATLDARIGAA